MCLPTLSISSQITWSMSSSLIPTERAAADMLEQSKGKTEVLKFFSDWLINQSVLTFFQSLEMTETGVIYNNSEKPVKMKSDKVIQFSSQSNIFGK